MKHDDVQTLLDAIEIARNELRTSGGNHSFVIDEQQTLERPFGWVFFYFPKRYLESRDFKDLVPGASPLIVRRGSGATEYLTTSRPPAVALEEFEKRWHGGR